MTKVLLTGGSGFIAAHLLEQLLEKGHTVITTVRSDEKARKIRDAYPDKADRLEVFIVPDIAKEDAFDEVVKTPGLEVVMHTASPFHFKFTDPKTELIDPALVGTTSILKALKRSAPSVKRVVVTSSFASILDEKHLGDPSHTFSEESWNPDGIDDIHRSPATSYRVSKKLAERAAWDFVADEKPNFDLVTVCPPLVFGPVVDHFANVESINTSNERVVTMLSGKWKDEIPSNAPVPLWVDVRDVAAAHVLGMELPEAGGRRLFTTAGVFSHREVVDITREAFPEFKDRLAGPDVQSGGFVPDDQMFKWTNQETRDLLKIDWIPLKRSIVDLVTVLKKVGV
jgi:nucleoside-diphosphate-sugar epimerase